MIALFLGDVIQKDRTWHFFKQSKVQWTVVASLKGDVTRDDRQRLIFNAT